MVVFSHPISHLTFIFSPHILYLSCILARGYSRRDFFFLDLEKTKSPFRKAMILEVSTAPFPYPFGSEVTIFSNFTNLVFTVFFVPLSTVQSDIPRIKL